MNEQRFWRKLNFYLSGNGLNRFVKKVEHLKKQRFEEVKFKQLMLC